MPLTVDCLMGMDPGTEPMHKDMATKLESFVPIFAKAIDSLGSMNNTK
jgi:hypothetical protein